MQTVEESNFQRIYKFNQQKFKILEDFFVPLVRKEEVGKIEAQVKDYLNSFQIKNWIIIIGFPKIKI